jgi:hypothetical protein
MAYGSLTRRVLRTICGGGAERLGGAGRCGAVPLCEADKLLLLKFTTGAREVEVIELRAEPVLIKSPNGPRPARSSESSVERSGAMVLGRVGRPLPEDEGGPCRMKLTKSEVPPPLTSGSRGTMFDLEGERYGWDVDSEMEGGLTAKSVAGLSTSAVPFPASSGRSGCSVVGRVERTKSAKSLVSSVITRGSRGRKPDLRVLVFIGSGREVKGLGGSDFRISDTRGTTFFGDCGFLGTLPTNGTFVFLGKLATSGELGFGEWETPGWISRGGERLDNEDDAEIIRGDGSPPALALWLLVGRKSCRVEVSKHSLASKGGKRKENLHQPRAILPESTYI